MTNEEKLSIVFNEMSDRHGELNFITERAFITENSGIEVHCIDIIGKNPDANVTKISKVFRMTRGAISKITKRLIKEAAIEAYQKPGNKKEVYYKLTELGKAIYLEHESLHRIRIERDSLLFAQLDEAEKEALIIIFTKISKYLESEVKKLEGEGHDER